MHLGTREARAVLKSDVTRSDFVWQTANLAGFISGCYSNDLDMIRDSFNDVIIEPQRQIADSGVQGRAARRHVGRGAGVFDFGRGTRDIRLGGDPERRGGARGDGGGVHGARSRIGFLDFRARQRRRPSGERPDVGELKYASSRAGAPASRLSEAIRQGLRRTAACTCRRGCRSSIPRLSRGITRLPEIARAALEGFFEGDRLRPCSARSRMRRSISRRRRPPSPKCADPLFVLELFHGPTAAFKDFGARFLAETSAAAAGAVRSADDHSGGDLGRHRRRGCRGISPAALGAHRHPVSERPGERAAGAAAHLLGR